MHWNKRANKTNKCALAKEIGYLYRFTVHITNIQQKSTEQFQLEQRIFKSIQTHQKNYSQNSTEWQTAAAAAAAEKERERTRENEKKEQQK